MNRPAPSAAAMLRACAAAIIVPVALVAVLLAAAEGDPRTYSGIVSVVLLFGLPIATAHVLILWLPAYLVLSRRRPLRWFEFAALGFVCGALPAAIAGGMLALAAFFGACGLVGGLSFRLALGRGQEKGRPVSEPPRPVIR